MRITQPATIIATAALVCAAAQPSYAAVTKLAANSVGTAQLKDNAVTTAKIKNATVSAVDVAPGTVRTGPRGPAGPAGAPGPSNAYSVYNDAAFTFSPIADDEGTG